MFCPDSTFRPRMSVLSAEQMEQMHQATLEVLERTGVRLTHPVLDLLAGAGARMSTEPCPHPILPGGECHPLRAHPGPGQAQRRAHRRTWKAPSTTTGPASTASSTSTR